MRQISASSKASLTLFGSQMIICKPMPW